MTAPLTTLLPTPTPHPLAASALLRAALDMLGIRPGQAVDALVAGTNAQGVTQLRIGLEMLAVRLSVPIPAGTPVRITAQPAPGGQLQLSVQPLPVPVATTAVPVVAPSAPLPAMPQPVPVVSVVIPPATAVPAPPAANAPTATAPAAPVKIAPASTQPTAAPPALPPSGLGQPPQSAPRVPVGVATTPIPTPAAQAPTAPTIPAVGATSPVPNPASPTAAAAPMPPAAASQGSTILPLSAPGTPPRVAAPTGGAPPTAGSGTSGTPAPLATAPATTGQLALSPTGPQATAPVSPGPTAPATASAVSGQAPSTHPAQSVSASAVISPPASRAPASAAPAQHSAPAPPPPTSAPATAPATPAARPTATVSLPLAQPAQAAARQDSMAPLLQNLSVLSARVAAEMPRPVAEPAMRLLNQRITLDRGAPTATTLKQAVLSAGVLTSPSSAGADTKTALLQLRAGLLAMLGDGEIAPVAPVARRPPPPHKDAQPRAMRAEPPTLSANTEPRDAARTLLGQTDAALSRLKLLQLASQPQETRPGVPVLPDLHIEIPMVLGHETAMAQLRIQKDGKGGGKPSERGWRLRFAVSFPQIGEVGAQVSLIGRTTSIALWAEEPQTAAALEEMLPDLTPALAARGLTVGSVRLRRGAPPDDSPAATGRLVDSRS